MARAVDAPLSPEEQLAEDISQFYDDPLGYVMYVFPWDTEFAIQMVELAEGVPEAMTLADVARQKMYRERFPNCKYGPDLWACDFLEELGKDIRERAFDGRTPVAPIRYVTASGHGIGKSTLVAFLVKFIMDTRPHAKGVVTAGTADQLRTKTWAEVGKWHKLSLTEHWFTYSSARGSMSLYSAQDGGRHKDTWRCDAQTCKEENSESFAGLHAANSTPFYIFDEGSGVPDKIYEVRDGGMTDGEPMVFDFGNPTRNTGRFFEECMGSFKHRYKVRMIDSRRVAITNKRDIAEKLEDHGEESDYFKVRVRGMFPSASTVQFIGTDEVDAAMRRELPSQRTAQLIIGVDVARFGDDESVIYPRIGDDARSFAPTMQKGRYVGLSTTQLVGKVVETVNFFRGLGMEYSALFVDGGNTGGAVVDILRDLGYKVTEVHFGGKPTDAKVYRYKGDEMAGKMKEHIYTRLCLPSPGQASADDIRTQLTQREFGFTLAGDKINLESKRDMKDRGISSPDLWDALALTYAEEVARTDAPYGQSEKPQVTEHDYDPLKLNMLGDELLWRHQKAPGQTATADRITFCGRALPPASMVRLSSLGAPQTAAFMCPTPSAAEHSYGRGAFFSTLTKRTQTIGSC